MWAQGVDFSPDGLCALTSQLGTIHLLEPKRIALSVSEPGPISCYRWYPGMNSQDTVSCVFATTCAVIQPVHLWDAYTGGLRACYGVLDPRSEEIARCLAVDFGPQNHHLVVSSKASKRGHVDVFALDYPGVGHSLASIPLDTGYCPIIKCVKQNDQLVVLGSFSGDLAVLDLSSSSIVARLGTLPDAVTDIQTNAPAHQIYAGCRRHDAILVYDIRQLGTHVASFPRTCRSAQKIEFELDLERNQLMTGGTDGLVRFYDLTSGEEVIELRKQFSQVVNGLSYNPIDSNQVCVALGERQVHLDDTEASISQDSQNLSILQCVVYSERSSSVNETSF